MHELQALLDSVPELQGTAVVDVLAGGPISDSYLLRNEDQQMVLRVDTRLAAVIGLDRIRELAVLGVTRRAEIGPEVIWAAPEQGLLVTNYLDGRVWSPAEATVAGNICRVARLLKRLHQLPADPRWPSLVDILDSYGRKLKGSPGSRLARQAVGLASQLGFGNERECSLCHGDVHAANLIVLNDHSLCLLDWEYAGRGHPWFDLATFATQHNLSGQQKYELLTAYQGSPLDSQVIHFERFCELYELVDELWRVLITRGRQAG